LIFGKFQKLVDSWPGEASRTTGYPLGGRMSRLLTTHPPLREGTMPFQREDITFFERVQIVRAYA
jgi:hypothetical protein